MCVFHLSCDKTPCVFRGFARDRNWKGAKSQQESPLPISRLVEACDIQKLELRNLANILQCIPYDMANAMNATFATAAIRESSSSRKENRVVDQTVKKEI